jgi:hypothetical protein
VGGVTVEEVRRQVEELRAHHDDPEGAHGDEDQLHEDVLRAIADGAPNAAELAALALQTIDIDFPRWYA